MYDYIYSKDKKGCYVFDNISVNNISLIDVKKDNDFDYVPILENSKNKIYRRSKW